MAPPALQRRRWLSGNGSFDLAATTVDIAFTPNRDCVFSLVESPESNGIARALSNTFKRDLVGVALTRTAAAWLEALCWIEDHNDAHPRSRLGWRP
jgi:putative transposase